MRHLLLMTLSIATAFVLVGAVANATWIAVTNEWEMGKSDPVPLVATTPPRSSTTFGGWNMTATTATGATVPAGYTTLPPTYVSPGAYTGSSLAMSFTNADSVTVPATQYCNSFAATSSHAYVSSTSTRTGDLISVQCQLLPGHLGNHDAHGLDQLGGHGVLRR